MKKQQQQTQHRPKQPNKMFPFLVNSVLFFFLSLSFKSPPFTSPRNQKRARYRIKTTITLRLGLYIYFFSASEYLFSLRIAISFGSTIRWIQEEISEEDTKIAVFFFHCGCVLFALSTRTRIQPRRTREREKKYPSQTRTFSWYLWIITTQWRSTMEERKSIEWREKKKQHNIDRVAYSTVG